jgi:hypothetical protein
LVFWKRRKAESDKRRRDKQDSFCLTNGDLGWVRVRNRHRGRDLFSSFCSGLAEGLDNKGNKTANKEVRARGGYPGVEILQEIRGGLTGGGSWQRADELCS